MTSISTKRGDDGTTGLLYGGRVRKDSRRIEANGAVDEAQAALGLGRAELRGGPLDAELLAIERDLWVLMAEVATAPRNRRKLAEGVSAVSAEMVDRLERRVHELEREGAVPAEFVVPGGDAGVGRARPGADDRAPRRAARGRARPRRGLPRRPLPEPPVRPVLAARPRGRGRARAGAHLRSPPRSCSVMMAGMATPSTTPTDVSTAPPDGTEVLGRIFFEGPEAASGPAVDDDYARLRRFAAKAGESLVLPGAAGVPEVLVGVGPRDAVDAAALRRAGAAFARAIGAATSAALDLTGLAGDVVPARQAVQAVGEGFWGARYRFSRASDQAPDELARLGVVVADEHLGEARAGLERAIAIAEAVRLARDLSNEPAGALTPTQLAEVAVEVAERTGLEATILDEEAIVAEGLGGLLGVAAGSVQPPRLIKLVYEPEGAASGSVPTVALVGKGITFDSGGLSLKTLDGMTTMKTDMSGAAAVLAVARRVPGPRRRACGCSGSLPLHREHAGRTGRQARRRAADAQRQDDRGAEHRRRGPAGARRRARAGGRGVARRHRRPRHADRGVRRGARPQDRRASWATTIA